MTGVHLSLASRSNLRVVMGGAIVTSSQDKVKEVEVKVEGEVGLGAEKKAAVLSKASLFATVCFFRRGNRACRAARKLREVGSIS